jgi:hypothetical protein
MLQCGLRASLPYQSPIGGSWTGRQCRRRLQSIAPVLGCLARTPCHPVVWGDGLRSPKHGPNMCLTTACLCRIVTIESSAVDDPLRGKPGTVFLRQPDPPEGLAGCAHARARASRRSRVGADGDAALGTRDEERDDRARHDQLSLISIVDQVSLRRADELAAQPGVHFVDSQIVVLRMPVFSA